MCAPHMYTCTMTCSLSFGYAIYIGKPAPSLVDLVLKATKYCMLVVSLLLTWLETCMLAEIFITTGNTNIKDNRCTWFIQ